MNLFELKVKYNMELEAAKIFCRNEIPKNLSELHKSIGYLKMKAKLDILTEIVNDLNKI